MGYAFSPLLPLAIPSWEGLGVGYAFSPLLPLAIPSWEGLGVGYASCLFLNLKTIAQIILTHQRIIVKFRRTS